MCALPLTAATHPTTPPQSSSIQLLDDTLTLRGSHKKKKKKEQQVGCPHALCSLCPFAGGWSTTSLRGAFALVGDLSLTGCAHWLASPD